MRESKSTSSAIPPATPVAERTEAVTDKAPKNPAKPPASPPAPPAKGIISDPKEQAAIAAKDPQSLRLLHGQRFSGHILRSGYVETIGAASALDETALAFVTDTLKQMEPRDPLERMLIEQMLWTHVRIGRLTKQAMAQERIEPLQVAHEAADRALNAFRRHMLALQEYRTPKPAASFTAIKQQNIALMNGPNAPKPIESQKQNPSNEKDATHDAQPKALPADTGTISLPAFIHPARQAVAVGDRPQDGQR